MYKCPYIHINIIHFSIAAELQTDLKLEKNDTGVGSWPILNSVRWAGINWNKPDTTAILWMPHDCNQRLCSAQLSSLIFASSLSSWIYKLWSSDSRGSKTVLHNGKVCLHELCQPYGMYLITGHVNLFWVLQIAVWLNYLVNG